MAEEDEGLAYWTRWQVFVCAAIAAGLPAAATTLLLRWKRPGHERLRPSDLWTPCWRNLSPWVLLAYRALVVVIMSTLLFKEYGDDGPVSFYFYTQWTFALVIIYFVIATVVSALGCWNHLKHHVEDEEANKFLKHDFNDNEKYGNSPIRTDKINESKNDEDKSEKSAGCLGYGMQIVYQTCGGAVLLTDIVFWGLLVPTSADNFTVNLIGTCMHSVNLVFLLGDTALNNQPFPMFRMVYFMLWSLIYVIFQWVVHASGVKWWPYPFLELATPWAPLWYFAMCLIHVPCYGVYWLIVKAKNTFCPKFFSSAYRC